jgi:thiol-disulfide isomerase/thioredoxin
MKSILARNVIISLIITFLLSGTVIFAINYLNNQRVKQISELQDQLATDTLSVETQFALLEEAPCEDLTEGNTLSQEVSSLGDRLALAESQLGSTNQQVIQLKKQYTLLQIRDYLLTKRLTQSCGLDPTVVLYFYSNKPGSCADCDRAAYALSYLHNENPKLRVYSFDYDLPLGALDTLKSVEKVKPTFPAFVIDGTLSYGFTTLDEFKESFPKDFFATTTATTTKDR